jgi:acetyl-CoA carboxylase carboxyl transferase subunit alpha
LGGAHLYWDEMSETLKKTIVNQIDTLSAMTAQERVSKRIDKFCAMGVVVE